MVDPTTVNLVMAQPLRGTDVGTWDVPVNGNTGILDQAFGGVTTLALSSANVTLAASQAQNSIIRLTGTLTVGLTINLPSIYKFWTIDNQITNSPSSFWVTLTSTSGGSILGCPPGTQDVFYDGTTLNYRNLGKVGEFWDYVGAVVPNWINNSTKPPYLNCNGTTFSSATYPILANLLGSNTLPDGRGRSRATLNQGTGRFTTAAGGLDGNTNLAGGGADSVTLSASQIPSITSANAAQAISVGSAGVHFPFANSGWAQASLNSAGGTVTAPFTAGSIGDTTTITGNNAISVTSNNTSSGPHSSVQPTYIGGITMIRAA